MFENILFSIDINDNRSLNAGISKVIELCESSPGCKLTIVHVVQTYGLGMIEEYFPKDWTKKIAKKSQEKLNEIIEKHIPKSIKPTVLIEKGEVSNAIIACADKIDADLIILTSLQPEHSDCKLGPNVSKVVRYTTRSVLVLR